MQKQTRLLQGRGAGNQISSSGSSSRHLKFLAPAPERFGSLKTKNHCIICTIGLLHKLSVERDLTFQAPAPSFKIFCSGSTALV